MLLFDKYAYRVVLQALLAWVLQAHLSTWQQTVALKCLEASLFLWSRGGIQIMSTGKKKETHHLMNRCVL